MVGYVIDNGLAALKPNSPAKGSGKPPCSLLPNWRPSRPGSWRQEAFPTGSEGTGYHTDSDLCPFFNTKESTAHRISSNSALMVRFQEYIFYND